MIKTCSVISYMVNCMCRMLQVNVVQWCWPVRSIHYLILLYLSIKFYLLYILIYYISNKLDHRIVLLDHRILFVFFFWFLVPYHWNIVVTAGTKWLLNYRILIWLFVLLQLTTNSTWMILNITIAFINVIIFIATILWDWLIVL